MKKYSVKDVTDHDTSHPKNCVAIVDNSSLEVELVTSSHLLNMRMNGASSDSVKNRAYPLCRLMNEIHRDKHIKSWQEITNPQMTGFLNLFDVKASTLHQYITHLKSFYTWAYEFSFIDNPRYFTWSVNENMDAAIATIKGKKGSTDPFDLYKQYISEQEFDLLLSYKDASRDFEIARDDLVLKMAYWCGTRASETVSNINFTIERIRSAIEESEQKGMKGILFNIVGKGKHGGKQREIYIPPSLKDQVLRFLNGLHKLTVNSNLLFCSRQGKPLHRNYATRVFDSARKNLITANPELADDWATKSSKRCYHSLRHTYATNFAVLIEKSNQLPRRLLQERMGHSHYETTLVYIHFSAVLTGDVEVQTEVSEQLHNSTYKLKESDT